MASSRDRAKKHSSSPSSAKTKNTEGQNRGAAMAMNTFANDGSFLELFKKRMEAESQKLQQKAESTVEQTVDREVKVGKEVDEGSCQEKLSEEKAPGPSVSLSQQGKRSFAVGKMGGATRQMHAKKKKKEKEAAEAAKKAEDEFEIKPETYRDFVKTSVQHSNLPLTPNVDNLFFIAESKSSAWKAYMEEVKRYKEMTCSEDGDRVCPLVK